MGQKILIVDADIDLAHILKEQLRDLNFLKVFIGTSPEVVYDLSEKNGFGYFFFDFETIARLEDKELARLAAANPNVNIVLMHSEYHAGVRRLQRALGARYFLKRTIRKEDLKEILQERAGKN